jgi:hypothetical protein
LKIQNHVPGVSMIAYDLGCSNGHSFEGWFDDEQSFLEQKHKNLVACPICNTTEVSRRPSIFAIKSSQKVKLEDAKQDDLADLGRKLSDFLKKNFDDVGCDFAKEALKIHYGASEPRNIRGVSTEEEEKTLRQEGVEFIKLPMPPSSESDS